MFIHINVKLFYTTQRASIVKLKSNLETDIQTHTPENSTKQTPLRGLLAQRYESHAQ